MVRSLTGPVLPVAIDPVLAEQQRPVSGEVLRRLASFAERWSGRIGNEQQLAQSFLGELCEALGTPRPHSGGLAEQDYCFEKRVVVPGGGEHGRIDLYKAKHFVLEAKCGRASADQPGSAPVRGTKAYQEYIRSAYDDQARVYASLIAERPPLLIVVDIGEHFWIWPGFDGRYEPFQSPRRIDIPLLRLADEDYASILRACPPTFSPLPSLPPQGTLRPPQHRIHHPQARPRGPRYPPPPRPQPAGRPGPPHRPARAIRRGPRRRPEHRDLHRCRRDRGPLRAGAAQARG